MCLGMYQQEGNAGYLPSCKDDAACASVQSPADTARPSHSLRVLVDRRQVWDAPKMQLVIEEDFPAQRIPAIETVLDTRWESS